MGFTAEQALTALVATENNFEDALDLYVVKLTAHVQAN